MKNIKLYLILVGLAMCCTACGNNEQETSNYAASKEDKSSAVIEETRGDDIDENVEYTDFYLWNDEEKYAMMNITAVGDVSIPSTFEYDGVWYKTIELAESALKSRDEMTSLSIPGTVKKIASDAVEGCDALESVRIEEGAEKIASRAFSHCSSLTDVVLPDSITEIDPSAFNNCTSLESFHIPANAVFTNVGVLDGVSMLENYEDLEDVYANGLFDGCRSLANITIDDNNVSYKVKDGVLFSADESILIRYPAAKEGDSYRIPDTVKMIAPYAFSDCKNLNEIIVPDSVAYLGRAAFSGMNGLNTINIPEGIVELPNMLFSGCDNLHNVEIPDTVVTIGSGAFDTCTGLYGIKIPDSVTSIGDNAFFMVGSMAEYDWWTGEWNGIEWKGTTYYSVEEFEAARQQ